jgi:hypothetical protein
VRLFPAAQNAAILATTGSKRHFASVTSQKKSRARAANSAGVESNLLSEAFFTFCPLPWSLYPLGSTHMRAFSTFETSTFEKSEKVNSHDESETSFLFKRRLLNKLLFTNRSVRKPALDRLLEIFYFVQTSTFEQISCLCLY